MTETREFQENFYILDDGRVRQFLITGPEEALLIDTGFPDSGVYSAVKALTDKPVKVALTHGDRDHTGGLEPGSGPAGSTHGTGGWCRGM